ncbi:hypothetical protein [Chamaesiphon sp. OTE_8_metabat_110]|nr:hypothetical protein [Chamaesiphon sp. OTE_8_metabat_110]
MGQTAIEIAAGDAKSACADEDIQSAQADFALLALISIECGARAEPIS